MPVEGDDGDGEGGEEDSDCQSCPAHLAQDVGLDPEGPVLGQDVDLGPMLQNFLRMQSTSVSNKLECLLLASISS